MQHNKNSAAGTERQWKLLVRPSQEIKLAKYTKLITKSRTHTHAHTQTHTHTIKNSCDELTTYKKTTKNLAGTYKFCKIDIADGFLKRGQTPEIHGGVGCLLHILMTFSAKKQARTSEEL